MGKTEQMHIRVEPALKAEAEAVLSQLGLRAPEFVRMALRQVVLQRGLPFAVRIPNAETIAALNEPTAQPEAVRVGGRSVRGHRDPKPGAKRGSSKRMTEQPTTVGQRKKVSRVTRFDRDVRRLEKRGWDIGNSVAS